jgi:tetratricopeptide (TPR) repeat protein
MVSIRNQPWNAECRLALLALLLAACDFTALSQTSPYVALVTALDGRVMIRKAAKTDFEKGVWGLQLHRGDQIKTSENSEVSLLFQNSNLITLGPNSNLTIGDNALAGSQKPVKVASPELASNLSLLTFRESRNGEASALAGLRAGASETDITLIAPRNSKIRSSQPSFEWMPQRPFESFTVTLLSDKGVLWTRKTPARRMDYPKDEPALERGKALFWTVEGENLFERAKSLTIGFTVLSPEDAKSVAEQEQQLHQTVGADKENSTLQFLLGAYYHQQGLLTEAIAQFRHIAEKNPAAPLPHEILGTLYAKIGLKDHAISELQKAVTLSQERQ